MPHFCSLPSNPHPSDTSARFLALSTFSALPPLFGYNTHIHTTVATEVTEVTLLSSAQGCRFCRAYKEELCRQSGSGCSGWLSVFWKASCWSCSISRLACCRSASLSSAVCLLRGRHGRKGRAKLRKMKDLFGNLDKFKFIVQEYLHAESNIIWDHLGVFGLCDSITSGESLSSHQLSYWHP